MSLLFTTILLLGLLGLLGAVVLYATARKFHVEEDPRIDEIASLLPGANCGGCGLKGCRDFATRCVAEGSLKGFHCPVSGSETIAKIASVLGVEASAAEKNVAVLRCNGSCSARPERFTYDGASSCAVMDAVAVGTRGCSFGCLGCGDCTEVCSFGAIAINPDTLLPEVDAEKCTACGACVKECPRHLLELRPAGRRDRRVWVACANRERGGIARKTCSAACIGCSKCVKACPFGAVTVNDNLSYIDPLLCKACGKCVGVCPTGAILATFPVTKPSEQSNA
ncbi:MAG: RnfABCDGE type electron transport complex subunit B [Bacteroidales bacterium]|nr:RnfABCDGE type electron transport complex subunit B [Bacteroidales bacterium]